MNFSFNVNAQVPKIDEFVSEPDHPAIAKGKFHLNTTRDLEILPKNSRIEVFGGEPTKMTM
jgi:hypothetical protein